MDIAISFDMTGSMTPCMYQLRCEINKLITNLSSNITDLNIGIITHGDYDSPSYLTEYIDLTPNINDTKNFIMTVRDATGNAFNDGEAYEEALHLANLLKWRSTAIKILIVIGDDIPHEKTSNINRNKIDWREELAKLNEKQVKIFGVQCPTLDCNRSKFFYEELNRISLEGVIIKMNQFSYIVDIILALTFTCYNKESGEQYEQELIDGKKYNRNMEEVFNTLLKREDKKVMVGKHTTTTTTTTTNPITLAAANLIPVNPGRFQVLTVINNTRIKDFVNQTGATFKVGRGFYELMKKETISHKKEVVLQQITSGDFFTGKDARLLLGLPETATVDIKANTIPTGYTAFVQSTSANRKLIGGTKFLYDIMV
jgi:hypothetical protein